MSVRSALKKAIGIVGLSPMAKELGINYQAINGWMDRNRMPDKEYSCRSNYSQLIEKATDGKVTVTDLLGHIPRCQELRAKKKQGKK